MRTICEFAIKGDPPTQDRTLHRGSRRVNTDRVRRSRAVISATARRAMAGARPVSSPVSMALHIYIRAPRRSPELVGQWAPRTPDSSNVLKNIEDALNGIAYADDRQIVHHEIHRVFAAEPSVAVQIRAIDASTAPIGASHTRGEI